MSFAKEGCVVLRNVIHPQLLKHLAFQFDMLKSVIYYTEKRDNIEFKGDEQVGNSFAHYGSWGFESLMEIIRPEVEKATKLQLYPTYSYARIYYNGATLNKHRDRYSCEISATACIENGEEPWDIFFETRTKKQVSFRLNPGDIAIYRGVELLHWREPYQGSKQIQAFLHYVDVNGPYSAFKYDTRPMLGMPSESKRPL